MIIEKVSMVVEIDGEVCLVVLPEERMLLLVELAASLSDSGKLPLKKLGPEYKFMDIS